MGCVSGKAEQLNISRIFIDQFWFSREIVFRWKLKTNELKKIV